MQFVIDEQTLDDLDLRNKYSSNSIFGLFNKVRTTRARTMLVTMFEQPLISAEEINQRTTSFRYFESSTDFLFPFTQEQLEIVENYLGFGGQTNYFENYLSLAYYKFAGFLLKDERLEFTIIGIQQTLEFLKTARLFVNKIKDAHKLVLFSNLIRKATVFFDDPDLNFLLAVCDTDYSFYTLQKLDFLCRIKLKAYISSVIELISMIDLFSAVAQTGKMHNFQYAEAIDQESSFLEIKGVSHPCLNNAIGNDICLNSENNLLFLTGANMAGKSTLMKSIGIAIYLAHIGFPVSAKSMRFTVKNGLYSSINVSDNLTQGLSHFYAEVLRVKKVAESVSYTGNIFVLFDELFKGTNVKDAYDASLAVTKAFVAHKNSIFIISTHITEVAQTLLHENLHFTYELMPTSIKDGKPHYSYILTPGISNDRHGMTIIKNERILELLKS